MNLHSQPFLKNQMFFTLPQWDAGRKVEEKCKTFPIKRLGVIYELSSDAHRTDIQAFRPIQNVLHLKIGWPSTKGILLHMAPEHHMAMSLLFHHYQIFILISDLNTEVYRCIDSWIMSSKA